MCEPSLSKTEGWLSSGSRECWSHASDSWRSARRAVSIEMSSNICQKCITTKWGHCKHAAGYDFICQEYKNKPVYTRNNKSRMTYGTGNSHACLKAVNQSWDVCVSGSSFIFHRFETPQWLDKMLFPPIRTSLVWMHLHTDKGLSGKPVR